VEHDKQKQLIAKFKPLDLVAPIEEQLETLVLYLEVVTEVIASEPMIEESRLPTLPATTRTIVLAERCLAGWEGLYGKSKGKPHITPEGAFLYYLKLKEEEHGRHNGVGGADRHAQGGDQQVA